jgi:hypothetical protein
LYKVDASKSSSSIFEMKAKVTGLDVSEKERAWSTLYPTPPIVVPPSNQQSESRYVLLELTPLGKENKNEERILTIRRDDIAELSLKVGDVISLRLSMG